MRAAGVGLARAGLVSRFRARCRLRFASDLPREEPESRLRIREKSSPGPRRLGPRSFNLRPEKEEPGALEDESEAPTRIKISEITPQEVEGLWPPQALKDSLPGMESHSELQRHFEDAMPPELRRKLHRPHLWLQHEDQDFVGTEDVGRFVKITRNDLLEHLPEGGCGELSRDLTLIPSRERDVGLMVRKLTIELIAQLSQLQNATDAFGKPCIQKAGFLVDGHKGVGKSQVLNLVAMWARKNGWLVVLEPTPGRYAREIADIKRSNNGIYIQSEFAQQFLEAMSLANRQLLQEIPVDLSSYGSSAIDGESTQVTRRLYEPLIEKTVDTEVKAQNLSGSQRLRRIAQYRRQVRTPSMSDVLQQPQNVWEIVEFGLDSAEYAVQAVAETFTQLQRQRTHPVLVVVDDWNECFPCSEYVSIRYDNTRFNGYIPAYHLSMPRALHRWDGRKYRRGLKLCATSWQRYKRRQYRPELLGVQDYEIRTVRNFTQQEFANYVMYLRLMNVVHKFPPEDLEYFYMLTQGNGWQARRILSTLY